MGITPGDYSFPKVLASVIQNLLFKPTKHPLIKLELVAKDIGSPFYTVHFINN